MSDKGDTGHQFNHGRQILITERGRFASVLYRYRHCGPATARPQVIVFLGHAGWNFLLFPVVSGAVLLVLIAWIYNNATQDALPAILVAASYRFGIPGKNAFVRRM